MRSANWILRRNLRSLPTRARIGRNTLVLILRPEIPRKSILRRTATCARSMGAHLPLTILVIAVGSKRMERRNPISVPPRKVERKIIL
jgi:hypothetical protein